MRGCDANTALRLSSCFPLTNHKNEEWPQNKTKSSLKKQLYPPRIFSAHSPEKTSAILGNSRKGGSTAPKLNFPARTFLAPSYLTPSQLVYKQKAPLPMIKKRKLYSQKIITMAHTFTNPPPPPPQPPPGSYNFFFFFWVKMATVQLFMFYLIIIDIYTFFLMHFFFFGYRDSKWLLAFKVVTLLILFLTLIRCFSECLTKFGQPCSGGHCQGLNGIPLTRKLPINEISLTDQNDSI